MREPKLRARHLLIMLVAALLVAGAVTYLYSIGFAYVSAYQGVAATFGGVYVTSMEGTNERGIWIDYEWDNEVNHLYTRTSKDPIIWHKGRYYSSSPAKVFLAETFTLDPDGDKYTLDGFYGVGDVYGVLSPPVVDRNVETYDQRWVYQDPNPKNPRPYYRYQVGEVIKPDGTKDVVYMELWITKMHVAIGMVPNKSEDEVVSAYNNLIVWLKFVPQDFPYFAEMRENGKVVGELKDVAFGLAKVQLAEKPKVYRSANYLGVPSPTTPHSAAGSSLLITSDMRTDMEIETLDWDYIKQTGQVIEYQRTKIMLNPYVFSPSGWYAPIMLTRLSANKTQSILFPIIGESKEAGDVIEFTLHLHTFVIGKWNVPQLYNPNWEFVDLYARQEEGWLQFLNNPLGMFLILLVVVFLLLAIFAPSALVLLLAAVRGGTRTRMGRGGVPTWLAALLALFILFCLAMKEYLWATGAVLLLVLLFLFSTTRRRKR